MKKKRLKWTSLISVGILLSAMFIGMSGISLANEFPLTITDDLDREVTIARQPERIISLSPANTEILFALNLGEKVVGITDVCNYPSQTEKKEKIGGYSNPNLEKIIELEPDLILASYGNPAKLINQLEELNYTVVGLNPKNIDDIISSITMVGKITGKDEEATRLTEEMKERIEAVLSETSSLFESDRPRILYVVWYKPLWTAGSGTFIDELIQKTGGINIAGDIAGWPQISLETVLEKNPQVVIVGEGHPGGLVETVKKEGTLWITDAFKYNKIYTIDADIISRTGPRIVDALEEMAKIIHPELFGENVSN
jgi:iron complex transport system substrate-binding protein